MAPNDNPTLLSLGILHSSQEHMQIGAQRGSQAQAGHWWVGHRSVGQQWHAGCQLLSAGAAAHARASRTGCSWQQLLQKKFERHLKPLPTQFPFPGNMLLSTATGEMRQLKRRHASSGEQGDVATLQLSPSPTVSSPSVSSSGAASSSAIASSSATELSSSVASGAAAGGSADLSAGRRSLCSASAFSAASFSAAGAVKHIKCGLCGPQASLCSASARRNECCQLHGHAAV